MIALPFFANFTATKDEKYFITAFFVYFDCNRNFYFQEKHNKENS